MPNQSKTFRKHKKTIKKRCYKSRKYQKGGMININLDEWKRIDTPGSHHCGLFLSDKYPDLILKCHDHDKDYLSKKINYVNDINSHIKLFVDIHGVQKIGERTYLLMEKFNGTATDIFETVFPTIVLDDMIKEQIINEQQKKDIIFNYTDRYTVKPKLEIDSKIYDLYIDKLYTLWNKYYEQVCKELTKLQLLLLQLGYDHGDEYLDNFGYILSNTPILKDFRGYNTIKILNKYVYFYFIDIDTIGKIEQFKTYTSEKNLDLPGYKSPIEFLIRKVNEGWIRYNFPLIGHGFNIEKYKHSFNNITEVEEYIFGENEVKKKSFISLKPFLDYEKQHVMNLKKKLGYIFWSD